jgi:hypothetical protein
MADKIYVTEGYVTADYIGYIADAQVIQPDYYIEEDYLTPKGYHEDQGSWGDLVVSANVIKSGIVNVSASVTQTTNGGKLILGIVQLDYYIDEDYLTPEGYYENQGSWSELVVSADVTKGGIVSLSASVTQTVAVGKIVSVNAEFISTVTQTATISHIEGADLFAFAEAQLQVEVSLIKDANIAATAVFDIATDGRVFRDLAAEANSLFDFDVVNERSRATSIETQAAFSFDSTVEIIEPQGEIVEASGSWSSEFTQAAISTPIKQTSSDLSSEFTQAVDAYKIIEFELEFESLFTPEFTVEGILNAFAILDSVSTVSVTANFISDTRADKFSQFFITAIPFRNINIGTNAVGEIESVDFLSDTSLNANPVKVADFEINVDSNANQTVLLGKIVNNQAEITATSQLEATAQLSVDVTVALISTASLVSTANVNFSANATLTPEFNLSSNIGKVQRFSASIAAGSSLYLSRKVGGLRPRNMITSINQPMTFSTVRKFGSHSITRVGSGNAWAVTRSDTFTVPAKTTDFYFETWIYFTKAPPTGLPNLVSISETFGSPNQSQQFAQIGVAQSGGIMTAQSTSSGQAINTWHHVAIVYNGSTRRISCYVNGTRFHSSIQNTSEWTGYQQPNSVSVNGYWDPDVQIYVDSLSFFHSRLGFDPESTTITVPTTTRADDISGIGIWNFDNNLFDAYVGNEVLTYQAALSSTTAVNAVLTGTSTFASSINSSATVQAVIGKLESADVAMTSQSTFDIEVKVTRGFEISLDSDSESTTTAEAIRNIGLDLYANASILAVGNRNGSIDLVAFAEAQLQAVVGVIEQLDSSMASSSSMSLTAIKITSVQSNNNSLSTLNSTAEYVARGRASLSATVGLTVTGSVIHITQYVYKIPQETRFININSESRLHKIRR